MEKTLVLGECKWSPREAGVRPLEALVQKTAAVVPAEGWSSGARTFAERKGERRLLLKLLRVRFGDLPQAALARVEEAELAQIERWGERVLTATTLDEVLGAV